MFRLLSYLKVFSGIALWLFVAACSEQSSTSMYTLQGHTMGTTYNIRLYSDAEVDQKALKAAVDSILEEVNRQMSTYQGSSEISQFNHHNAPHAMQISDDFARVVAQSFAINQQTQGFFDVTVGPLVNLWGFGPDGRPVNPPTHDQVEQALEKTGMGAIKLEGAKLSKSDDRYIDLSAIAKGYGVDLVAEYLLDRNLTSFLVEIGGEIRTNGQKPNAQSWRLAVESPHSSLSEGTRQVQNIVELGNEAMATSGNYRNFYEIDGVRYSHTIDPFTGYPSVHNLASVTIVASNCAKADALATAMLVMGDEKALKLANEQDILAYFIVHSEDGLQVQQSNSWQKRFPSAVN
ncbi:FAD:protein FMN transferase [Bermanella sp. R86510]|uniref:FAD:protein FMN transferase n=1 Tax=unclassified Bermanella TaxID=2627862 RepID=UPI0037C69166